MLRKAKKSIIIRLYLMRKVTKWPYGNIIPPIIAARINSDCFIGRQR